jgi:anti-anti-sigma regulatory factor
LAFATLGKPVRELFHLAGLEELFIIEETPEAAAGRLTAGK